MTYNVIKVLYNDKGKTMRFFFRKHVLSDILKIMIETERKIKKWEVRISYAKDTFSFSRASRN